MSATASWHVSCDVCGDDDGLNQAAGTAAEARDRVRSFGWHVGRTSGRRDICDLCWDQGER